MIKRDKLAEFVLAIIFIVCIIPTWLGFNIDLFLGFIISVCIYSCWLIDLKIYLLWKKDKLQKV